MRIDDHTKENRYNVAVELGYIPDEDRAEWRKAFLESKDEDELNAVMTEARTLALP